MSSNSLEPIYNSPLPVISVLMSVFNNVETLEQAIKSIVEQDYRDWELIIIDDASTDKTFSLLKRFQNKDSRIKLFQNDKNIGLSHSLNKAFAASSGKYIARMDADDSCYPSRLGLQKEYLEEHPNIDVVGCNADIVDERGIQITTTNMPLTPEKIRQSIIRINPLIHPSVMIKRSFFEAMGGYNGELRKKQDYDLWLRGVDNHQFANLDLPLIRYRIKNADTLASDLYGFRVRVINSIRRKTLITGIFWAVIVLVTNIFRKFGYRQMAFRH